MSAVNDNVRMLPGKRIVVVFGEVKKPAIVPIELNWISMSALVRSRFNLQESAKVSLLYEYIEPTTKEHITYTINNDEDIQFWKEDYESNCTGGELMLRADEKIITKLEPIKISDEAQGKEFNVKQFLSTPLVLESFEPNGAEIRMLGREEQVEIVRYHMVDKNPSKMRVFVVSSSRGMGKTFFLAKLSRMIDGPLTPARKLGRIVAIECANMDFRNAYGGNCEKFWARVVVRHLSVLFRHCKVNIGDLSNPQYVVFHSLAFSEIIRLETQPASSNPFLRWARSLALEQPPDVIQEFIRITNNMFNTQDTTWPVFLFDNAHRLTTPLPEQPDNRPHPDTVLSAILSTITRAGRPVCIVAGTNDGYLESLGDYSSFFVVHIRLTTLGVKCWNTFGTDHVAYQSKMHNHKIVWAELDIMASNERQGVSVFTSSSPVMNMACEDDPQEPHEDKSREAEPQEAGPQKDKSQEKKSQESKPQERKPQEGKTQKASDDNFALLTMFYKCCEVPRLMRIAVQAWYQGKRNSWGVQQITLYFEHEVQSYYVDVLNAIHQFTPMEAAIIFLKCSVHWPLKEYLLEGQNCTATHGQLDGAKFNVHTLVDAAIIFPYYTNPRQKTCSYVLPSIIWECAQKDPSSKRTWWVEVKDNLRSLVPGMDWEHLHQSFISW